MDMSKTTAALIGGAVAGGACALTFLGNSGQASVLPPPRGKIVLHYFPFPAMGEPIRLLLALSDLEWEDKVVDFKTWKEGTLKKQATWGQMPFAILGDGSQMTQSRAMTKYFANFATVNGQPLMPTDPMVVFRIDELIDVFEDMLNKLRKTFNFEDKVEKSKAREALFAPDGDCTSLFTKMEAVCGTNALVGEVPTYGDLYFYTLIGFLRCGFWQDPAPGFPSDFINKYPKLKNICAKFGTIPAVKAYYAKAEGDMYKVFQ